MDEWMDGWMDSCMHAWMHGLDWIGLDWVELDWVGLDWVGLDWIGLGWIGLDCILLIQTLHLSQRTWTFGNYRANLSSSAFSYYRKHSNKEVHLIYNKHIRVSK